MLLGLRHNGEHLDPEHGGPLRLLVPHLYAWKSCKWIRGLIFMEEDKAGYWETSDTTCAATRSPKRGSGDRQGMAGATPAARRRRRASAAFLALAQATFFLLRNRDFLGPEMAVGLTKFSVLLSVVTVLLLLPVAAFGRRFLPAWRSGDRLGASWAVCFGLAAALVGWMIAAVLTAAPAVPRASRRGSMRWRRSCSA